MPPERDPLRPLTEADRFALADCGVEKHLATAREADKACITASYNEKRPNGNTALRVEYQVGELSVIAWIHEGYQGELLQEHVDTLKEIAGRRENAIRSF